MPRYACPICGDPNAYLIWVDEEPPDGCPHDDLRDGNGIGVRARTVTECRPQMLKARQRAWWRKLVPDAFDESGNIKPGELVRVLEAHHRERPDEPLYL